MFANSIILYIFFAKYYLNYRLHAPDRTLDEILERLISHPSYGPFTPLGMQTPAANDIQTDLDHVLTIRNFTI